MDAVWHVLNFLGPALGTALWSSALAKALWWRSLRLVPWWALMAWALMACALVLTFGLLVFGQDGKIATYGLMVLACAVSLWWRGFRLQSPSA